MMDQNNIVKSLTNNYCSRYNSSYDKQKIDIVICWNKIQISDIFKKMFYRLWCSLLRWNTEFWIVVQVNHFLFRGLRILNILFVYIWLLHVFHMWVNLFIISFFSAFRIIFTFEEIYETKWKYIFFFFIN